MATWYEVRSDDNPLSRSRIGSGMLSRHRTLDASVRAVVREERRFEQTSMFRSGGYLRRVIVAVEAATRDERRVGPEEYMRHVESAGRQPRFLPL